MGEAINLGSLRSFRAGVGDIKRAHPNACAPSLDTLERDTVFHCKEFDGWIDTMVKHIEKNCLGCGVVFIAGRRDKVFHSQECKNDWHQRRMAALKEPSELEKALETALRLTRARSPEASNARRIVYAWLSAEFTPAPIGAAPFEAPIEFSPLEDPIDEVSVDNATRERILRATHQAPIEAITAEAVHERLSRVMEGDKGLTQKDIANASGVEPTALSRFITGARPLGMGSLARLAIWLNSHERKVEPR